MSHLHAIAYVSNSLIGASIARLEHILSESRRLNLENAITGVLLHHDGSFMQYLEGARRDVLSTYDRIVRSPQHDGIIELMNEPISIRSFSLWTMGNAQATSSELLALSTADWKRLLRRGDGLAPLSAGLELMREFWAGAERVRL
jgi:hypothetical protein